MQAFGRGIIGMLLGLAFGVSGAGEAEAIPPELFVVPVGEGEADVAEDRPGWYSVVRIRYQNGSRYDIVYSEHCNPEERAILAHNAIPEGAKFLGIRDTETFGDSCQHEHTASWWVEE